jgi:1-aminocyclopropane-1-carboxylate deaminase
MLKTLVPTSISLISNSNTFLLCSNEHYYGQLRAQSLLLQNSKWVTPNKRRKIQGYIQNHSQCLVSFGGPYSNHLLSLAGIAAELGLKSVGFVTGNASPTNSALLHQCQQLGMELCFIGYCPFSEMVASPLVLNKLAELSNFYPKEALTIIPPGGEGEPGVLGAATLWPEIVANLSQSNSGWPIALLATAGTGTTAAGLLSALFNHSKQNPTVAIPKLHVYSPFTDGTFLQPTIVALARVPASFAASQFVLHPALGLGRFGRQTPEIDAFLDTFSALNPTLPLPDTTYLAKLLMYASKQNDEGYFGSKNTILITG